MERLTERTADRTAILSRDHFAMEGAAERLAEYEETGLTPEGVAVLMSHPDHAYAHYVKEMWNENGGMERMEEAE